MNEGSDGIVSTHHSTLQIQYAVHIQTHGMCHTEEPNGIERTVCSARCLMALVWQAPAYRPLAAAASPAWVALQAWAGVASPPSVTPRAWVAVASQAWAAPRAWAEAASLALVAPRAWVGAASLAWAAPRVSAAPAFLVLVSPPA
jgi:hypothetical protein